MQPFCFLSSILFSRYMCWKSLLWRSVTCILIQGFYLLFYQSFLCNVHSGFKVVGLCVGHLGFWRPFWILMRLTIFMLTRTWGRTRKYIVILCFVTYKICFTDVKNGNFSYLPTFFNTAWCHSENIGFYGGLDHRTAKIRRVKFTFLGLEWTVFNSVFTVALHLEAGML